MKLPNREEAFIPSAKLNNYLLSISHSIGKSKAKFFYDYGFDRSNAGTLKRGLLSIALTEEVNTITASPFGTKYVIDGLLMTPVGTMVDIRTVWIVEIDKSEPRFVTAYPCPK